MSILGLNAKFSKKVNREVVLKTIYNHKPISRADIAKITGLTSASITKIINEFINIGLVKEKNKVGTKSGRKPILLDIDKDSYYIISISISRKKILVALANINSEIINEVTSTRIEFGKNDFAKDIIKTLKIIMKKKIVILFLGLFMSAFACFTVSACTNFLITKGASTDGSSMITYAADSHVLYGELYFWPAAECP